ncbi:tyrosine-type recombinase/integrase [Oxalobacter formigenes]
MVGKKTKNHDLPPRMTVRTYTNKKGEVWTGYYYYGKRDENGKRQAIPLGSDLNEAKRKWSELECKPLPSIARTVSDVYARYMAWAENRELSRLSIRTIKDRHAYWRYLEPVYGFMDIDSLKPVHVMPYFNRRTSKVSAKKEIKFLSVMFNWAIANGFMTIPNPITGLTRQMKVTEHREIYVTDTDIALVYKHGSNTVKHAIELAYLTGQRPGDVRKMKWSDIKDGALEITQNKTKAKLRIAVVGALANLLDRIKSQGIVGMTILSDPKGNRLTESGHLRNEFRKARAAAEKEAEEQGIAFTPFQFRDLRAKAASDLDNIISAQKLLGHRTQNMTAAYIRGREKQTVNPIMDKSLLTMTEIEIKKKGVSN